MLLPSVSRHTSRSFAAGVDLKGGAHRSQLNINVLMNGAPISVVTSPNRALFAKDANFTAVGPGGEEVVELDRDLFHEGEVVGDPGSHAHFSVHNSGAVEGVIRTSDGRRWVLEAVQRYSEVERINDTHDTVIYAVDDIHAEALRGYSSSAGMTSCGIEHGDDSPHAELRRRQRRRMGERAVRTAGNRAGGDDVSSAQGGYEAGSTADDPVNCLDIDDPKCSCTVNLIGDYEFFLGPHSQKEVRSMFCAFFFMLCNIASYITSSFTQRKIDPSSSNYPRKNALPHSLTSRFGLQHMINVLVGSNKIYRETNFGGLKGIGFVVKSATVYTYRGGGNPVPHEEYGGAVDFLDAVTDGLRDRSENVCNSMLFTHRDFSQGVLGMAWVSDERGYGGICDRDFNHAFCTGINHGQISSAFISSLVFTHEIAHNLGAEHDPETPECSPGDEAGGNFIMFPAATDGTERNNHLFSPCSTAQISKVISILRETCFVETGLHCGDGVVDGDEECDCGNQCTPSGCCTSQCTINKVSGHVCSPQNPIRFPCCEQDCTFKAKGEMCAQDNECSTEGFCTGKDSACHFEAKADETECNCLNNDCVTHPGTNPQTCDGGVCTKFICSKYGGASQCGLSAPNSCHLGCAGEGWGTESEPCASTFDKNRRHPNITKGRFLAAGSPCNQNLGLCTAEGECRLIFQADTKKAPPIFTQEWFEQHWQYITIAVGSTLLIGLFVMHVQLGQNTERKRAEMDLRFLMAAAAQQADEDEQAALLEGDADEWVLPSSPQRDLCSTPGKGA